MYLVQTLEEQIFLGFTGKVNVVSRNNKESLGTIFLRDGMIINASLGSLDAFEALLEIFILELEQQLNFICEPETLGFILKKIHYPFGVIKKKAQDYIISYKESVRDAPPENIKVALNAEKFEVGKSLSSFEFDTLKIVCDYNKVSDIYEKSPMVKHKVAASLVTLRRKGFLKVIR